MSGSDDELVTLVECEDGLEAESVRSLLEAHGIAHVVHGDPRGSFSGLHAGVTHPLVLVKRRDVQTATELLEAKPVLEGAGALEGNECPVHQQPAVATCVRCGSFLCAGCGKVSVCEDCAKIDEPKPAPSTAANVAYAIPLLLAAAALWWIFTR